MFSSRTLLTHGTNRSSSNITDFRDSLTTFALYRPQRSLQGQSGRRSAWPERDGWGFRETNDGGVNVFRRVLKFSAPLVVATGALALGGTLGTASAASPSP